ncbi:MAG: type III-A CRISPR-associated RAMP protein Csm3 [bacterium]
MDNDFKLLKKIFITGTIEVKTGLCIGGSSVGLEIGGADKVVVRNPINNQPYIPGSSLKGKMRSLLERFEGKMSIKEKKDEKGNIIGVSAEPCECGTCLICQIFGLPAEKKGMPARLIVRDGMLQNPELLEKSKFTDMPYAEIKAEVVIDRITSVATPRTFERVPAGAKFNLNLVCNIYNGDTESDILKKIFESLIKVQEDYLGGSGTRGYGEIKITINTPLKYKDQTVYEGDNNPKSIQNNSLIPSQLLS